MAHNITPTDANSYELSLNGFEMPEGDGTASLRVLASLHRHLEPIAQGAVRLAMTGNSQPSRGRKMAGLTEATEFSLHGLREGSTILEMSAPKLGVAMRGQPAGDLFMGSGFDSLPEESALSVAMKALNDAFHQDTNSPLLDRHLLQQMYKLNSLFPNNDAFISLSNQKAGPPLVLTREKLRQLAPLTASVPPQSKVTLVGKLDEMKHSASVLKLVMEAGDSVKVLLVSELSIDDFALLFGKSIRVQGEANYNAAGRILSVEAERIGAADGNAVYFNRVHTPMTERVDLIKLRTQQNYRGLDLAALRASGGDISWADDESFEEMVKHLSS